MIFVDVLQFFRMNNYSHLSGIEFANETPTRIRGGRYRRTFQIDETEQSYDEDDEED